MERLNRVRNTTEEKYHEMKDWLWDNHVEIRKERRFGRCASIKLRCKRQGQALDFPEGKQFDEIIPNVSA